MGKEHANTEYKRNRAIILSNKPDCAYCGRPADTVDHITAIMNGGGHELENLQACCAQCNNRKGHKEVAQRNQTVSHARAEAMRNHAIPIAKTEPFFSETRTFTPTQVFSIPTGPNQPALALVGHAQPRLETSRPEHAGSFAPQVREWAREYLGVELMEWQYTALDGQLLHDADLQLVNRVSLVSTARQCGKTTALMALVGWWLTEMPKIRGKKQTVLSTSHRLDLAVMLFDELAPVLESRFNATLMKSYGRNRVTMPDGSTWLVRAANNSVGHGMSPSLVVTDEMWDISDEVLLGLLPAQRAQISPLLSMWSTAGTEASTAMLRWREQGLRAIDTGKNSAFYFAEWSPPPELNPMTPAAWAYGNPALGITLTAATLQAESENPDRAAFLRASCNLWVASDKSWIQPGQWPALLYDGPVPDGGTVAIETSLDDTRYFAVRCVALPDRRTIATVEFVADTFSEMLSHVERLCANSAIKFAITPTVDNHWPTSLERRRIIVGYGDILKFTPSVRNMINEKLLWHDGSTQLAEHVARAVAVRSQNSIALSSQRSPGPIELARCMVWAAALTSRPTSSGKPMLVVV